MQFYGETLKQKAHKRLPVFLALHPGWGALTGALVGAGTGSTWDLGLTWLQASSQRQSPMLGCAAPGTSPRDAVQHTTHVLDCFHSLTLRAVHGGWEQHTEA